MSEKMVEDISAYLADHDYSIIPNVIEALEANGHEVEGDHEITFSEDSNIIIWSGVSEDLATSIIEGLTNGDFHLAPELIDRYMDKGIWMDLPEAVKFPKLGYTTPHWSVVCLRPGPMSTEEPAPEAPPEEA